MRRSISTIALLFAAAAAVAGCGQTQDILKEAKESAFSAPSNLFKVDMPDWAQPNDPGTNFDLGPKGPVAANDLISATGYCAPSTHPAPAPQAAAPAPQPAAAPPSDQLEPAGAAPILEPPMIGGVALGMSECEVARRLGAPANVSISAGPKAERRVVLTYTQGDRPGLYSFRSGRLVQVDATPVQAQKYDKQAQKQARDAREKAKRDAEHMYVR